MQFLRELVHSDTVIAPSGQAPERSAHTPPLPPPDTDALKEEARLLKEQLNAMTLTAAAAQKSLAEAQADVDYWKAEALKAVVSRPASVAALTESSTNAVPAPNEEAIALKQQLASLQQEMDGLKVETSTKIRSMLAVQTKDREDLEKELERSDVDAKETKEENERLRCACCTHSVVFATFYLIPILFYF